MTSMCLFSQKDRNCHLFFTSHSYCLLFLGKQKILKLIFNSNSEHKTFWGLQILDLQNIFLNQLIVFQVILRSIYHVMVWMFWFLISALRHHIGLRGAMDWTIHWYLWWLISAPQIDSLVLKEADVMATTGLLNKGMLVVLWSVWAKGLGWASCQKGSTSPPSDEPIHHPTMKDTSENSPLLLTHEYKMQQDFFNNYKALHHVFEYCPTRTAVES